VRRGSNLNVALDRDLRADAHAQTPIEAGTDAVAAIESLFLDHLKPIYLVFDQFEEIFVLGDRAEQDQFFATLKAILDANTSCRVIISLREEYLAALDPFETVVPTLFDKRLRIEQMTTGNVEKVILGTTQAYGIELENGAATAEHIIAQLDPAHSGIQLTYLQIYLDHLWRQVRSRSASPDDKLVFTDKDVEDAGRLDNILVRFLDSQTVAIQTRLENAATDIKPGSIARLLDQFVSQQNTKQPMTVTDLAQRLPGSEAWLEPALAAFEQTRLLRKVEGQGHYELAHDALALPIGQARSAGRKSIAAVQRIIRDQMAVFEETRAYLSADQLSVVNRALKLRDPLTTQQELVLNSEEETFVTASRSRARRGMVKGCALVLGTVIVALAAFIGLLVYLADGIPGPKVPTINTLSVATELLQSEERAENLFPLISQYEKFVCDGNEQPGMSTGCDAQGGIGKDAHVTNLIAIFELISAKHKAIDQQLDHDQKNDFWSDLLDVDKNSVNYLFNKDTDFIYEKSKSIADDYDSVYSDYADYGVTAKLDVWVRRFIIRDHQMIITGHNANLDLEYLKILQALKRSSRFTAVNATDRHYQSLLTKLVDRKIDSFCSQTNLANRLADICNALNRDPSVKAWRQEVVTPMPADSPTGAVQP
jgi:DNA-binding IscR family transcriptional regulator